jgi:hypothetical protein
MPRGLQAVTIAVLALSSSNTSAKSSGDSAELARSPRAMCDLRDDQRFLYWTTVDYSFGRPGPRRASRAGGGQAIDWRYERATIQRLPKAGGVPETLVEVKGDRLSNLDLDETQ